MAYKHHKPQGIAGSGRGGASSNVRQVSYNNATRTMKVVFQSREQARRGVSPRAYVYEGVPLQVYRRFTRVGSMGRFHWRNIRDKYTYTRLSGGFPRPAPSATAKMWESNGYKWGG